MGSEELVYNRLKAEIARLKPLVVRTVVRRARISRSCDDCAKPITRYQVQTMDGRWHHIECLDGKARREEAGHAE